MRNKRTFLFAVVLTTSFFAMLLAVSRTVIAQGSGRVQARSQIRATVDCDCRSPSWETFCSFKMAHTRFSP